MEQKRVQTPQSRKAPPISAKETEMVDSKEIAEEKSKTEGSAVEAVLECPVCLQTCVHPVKLPCNHIFCFLCVKGVANQSKRCALCRTEIPSDYLYHPALVKSDELEGRAPEEDGYQWFYKGNNGWWQYDERTSNELEEKFKNGETAFELLIAGFLYVIDMENMLQIRRNEPARRRKIKRDLSSAPKKGVAGLKIASALPQDREGADGKEDTAGAVGGVTVKSSQPPPSVTSTYSAPATQRVNANTQTQTTNVSSTQLSSSTPSSVLNPSVSQSHHGSSTASVDRVSGVGQGIHDMRLQDSDGVCDDDDDHEDSDTSGARSSEEDEEEDDTILIHQERHLEGQVAPTPSAMRREPVQGQEGSSGN